MKVWIVGKFIKMHMVDMAWEFQGVFSTEAKAVDACLGHDEWFIGLAIMDEELPVEKVEWPGFYYPAEKDGAEVEE